MWTCCSFNEPTGPSPRQTGCEDHCKASDLPWQWRSHRMSSLRAILAVVPCLRCWSDPDMRTSSCQGQCTSGRLPPRWRRPPPRPRLLPRRLPRHRAGASAALAARARSSDHPRTPHCSSGVRVAARLPCTRSRDLPATRQPRRPRRWQRRSHAERPSASGSFAARSNLYGRSSERSSCAHAPRVSRCGRPALKGRAERR